MARSIVRAAVLSLLVVTSAYAGDVVSTQCRETEVALAPNLSASKLERCADDERSSLLWHLDRIDQIQGQLDGVFDRRNGGAGSVVYVMDTGVMATHSEFAGATGGSRVIGGFDATGSVAIGRSLCLSDDKSIAPCYNGFEELAAASHGTSVASIVAGRNVGVAPEAMIFSVRVMNERGLATTRTYLDGLNAVIRHAWDPTSPTFRTGIVNISGWVLERLTGNDGQAAVPFATVERKMREMISGVDASGRPDTNGKRFLFVVAANNTDGGCGDSGIIDRFPATLGTKIDGLITVGGMTPNNTAWSGGCRGGVEVLAPAQSIFSATITAADHFRGQKPNLRSGTSFAAPIISGIAARLLADRSDLTPQQLEAWITATPSRIESPSRQFADGKVAYVRSVAPATAMAASRSAE